MMGKKVGILSMQRIQNYGSFLQAYGLMKMIEELGADVQFVDYHPGTTLIPAKEGTGIKRKLIKVMDAMKGSAPLKEKIRFVKYKSQYADKYNRYLGITEKRNYSPEIDVLVIGSDEVFNCVQDNTNVGFSPELFGRRRNSKKLISYAASFGNTSLVKLDQYGVKKRIGKWLNEFDAISVRDNNSGEIVRELTGRNPLYNLDPVLMYEFINIPDHVKDKGYMILYGYSRRFSKLECKKIRSYANKKNLKIFCIGGIQDCCDKFIDVNPFEVISYFKHADCVVTDTFHGTILSVITHKQFITIVRDSGYGNSQKLNDLLKRLKLENRRMGAKWKMEQIEKQIDYTDTDGVIAQERKKTRDYLQQWLT